MTAVTPLAILNSPNSSAMVRTPATGRSTTIALIEDVDAVSIALPPNPGFRVARCSAMRQPRAAGKVRHAGGAVFALTVSLTVPKASAGLDVAFLGDNGIQSLTSAPGRGLI
jgi:hypothetical protein